MPEVFDFTITAPLESIRLANGRVISVRPFDPEGWEMYKQVKATGDNAMALQLMQRILPDATPDDIETLSDIHTQTVVLYAQGKVNAALALVGNSSGAGAGSSSLPSPPPSTPSTS